MEEKDFVSIWLEESGNPAIEALTMANHEIADKMAKLLSEKGLNSADLSIIADINHQEISSWLNGMHTFSRKKLNEISQAMAARHEIQA